MVSHRASNAISSSRHIRDLNQHANLSPTEGGPAKGLRYRWAEQQRDDPET